MIRTIAILSTIPFLTGCNLNDLINPGADSRIAYEHRASMLMAPKPEPEVQAAPVIAQKPDCVVTFRINRCDSEGNPEPWYYL